MVAAVLAVFSICRRVYKKVAAPFATTQPIQWKLVGLQFAPLQFPNRAPH
jgi:hypothetical protein